MFLIRVRTVWNDYFPGYSPSQTFATTKYTTVQSTSSTNVFVSNSLFSGCTSASHGGALSCSDSVQRLLIESSSFFSCSTSSYYGGAIYFSNTNTGECVLYKVCGNDCCSTYTSSNSYGQFTYINVQNTVSNKNYVNYSSISRCVNHNSNSYRTLYHYNGKIYSSSINVSMNKCQCYSGFYCNAYIDSSVTCLIWHSSFTDNIASGYTCITQYRTNAKAEMKCCNVLRNTQGSSNSIATIRFDGHSTVKDSCILMNNATYTFYALSNYIITVSNCTIDSTNHQNSVIFTNTITKSFIHALNHLSTQNCASEYDSAGTLTAIGTSKNNIVIYTYNCKPGISDLFTLTYLFMVTFIHSDSSS
jgi:hypothetical protein